MATFRYTALSDGAPSNGTIEANDRSDALRLLAAQRHEAVLVRLS